MARSGRKKKSKKVKLAPVNIANVQVDNPFYSSDHIENGTNRRKISAKMNMRESYAGMLYGRRAIDEAQWQAASKMRRTYEIANGSAIRSVDLTETKVDTSKNTPTISDSHVQARKTLERAEQVLGQEGYQLAIQLTGMGMSPVNLSKSEMRQKYLRERFKECLDTLAGEWGFKTPVRQFG